MSMPRKKEESFLIFPSEFGSHLYDSLVFLHLLVPEMMISSSYSSSVSSSPSSSQVVFSSRVKITMMKLPLCWLFYLSWKIMIEDFAFFSSLSSSFLPPLALLLYLRKETTTSPHPHLLSPSSSFCCLYYHYYGLNHFDLSQDATANPFFFVVVLLLLLLVLLLFPHLPALHPYRHHHHHDLLDLLFPLIDLATHLLRLLPPPL